MTSEIPTNHLVLTFGAKRFMKNIYLHLDIKIYTKMNLFQNHHTERIEKHLKESQSGKEEKHMVSNGMTQKKFRKY